MNRLILVMSVALAACAFSTTVKQGEWETFKLKHNKKYQSAEEERNRIAIYAKNKIMVAQHNKRHSQGLTSFRMKLNQFSDRFHSELQDISASKVPRDTTVASDGSTYNCSGPKSLPSFYNWTENGAVTPVKDQGNCESSWAFSATGALEGQYFLKTGHLLSLSEQNLIDCSSEYGNRGRQYGNVEDAFNYVKKNGIDLEKTYPYGGCKEDCKFQLGDSGVTVEDFKRLPRADEYCLQKVLVEIGPISVEINCNQDTLRFYKSGVYFDPTYASENETYSMLVVGYGTDQYGGDYWLIKSSWGTGWADRGYLKLARNRGNHCGVASNAVYPIV